MKIQNPILRGFYPDPSACEANGKFYLCSSTFQYLPGAPIFESEDLINWHQVANCLTSTKQIELNRVPSSGGMFAPTLRFHEGIFYMVTNNNTYGKNFYVYTEDLNKEWSEPVFVDQDGIDPSILFDEDGKTYFTSNGNDEKGACIRQCEIDIKTGERLTESRVIWRGSGGRYIESPHLYHIGDWYYLLVAEGGTEYGHMVTYARSKEPFGPFEGYPLNPVLTNRNLGGNESIIQGIGHGDLIKDKNGNYFILCLGFRQQGEWMAFHQLGREVYIAPVYFEEDGWFKAGDNGTVREYMELPLDTVQKLRGSYDFSFDINPLKDMHYMYLRDYHREDYFFDEKEKALHLKGSSISLDEADTPTFIALRQSEFNIDLNVSVSGNASEAGISIYMDEDEHYDLIRYIDYEALENEMVKVALRIRTGDAKELKDEAFFSMGSEVHLNVTSDAERYYFNVIIDKEKISLGKARSKYLSSESAGGFTGVMLGMYAYEGEGIFRNFSLKQS